MEFGHALGLQVFEVLYRRRQHRDFSGGLTTQFEWLKQMMPKHFAKHTIVGDSCVSLKKSCATDEYVLGHWAFISET